ncbi:MAG TPA: DUF488 family protein [Burkholderiaceae bacterium]|jgi:uncharacterized protein YeaO (DUF488 family)|nr:DUF488 family protein [Burkholderiaceae bacterium]
MSIRIVRLGEPRETDEGVRIGTVRRPPRGVPKAEFASRDYYDVWMPLLSPSLELMTQAKAAHTPAAWERFARKFRAQMGKDDSARLLDLLAMLSKTARFSVGCYCEDENHCHRSVLRQLLAERGATIR